MSKQTVEGKKCTKCGEFKDFSEYYKGNSSGGRASWCKVCYTKYRKKNKGKISEYTRKYYEENKEKKIEYIRKYQKENKERISEYMKGYLEENKERKSEYMKIYHEENKERISEYKRDYYSGYYKENKERLIEKNKVYQKENKDVYKAARQNRRARKKKLPNTLTSEQTTHILQRGCALTGVQDNLHLDHFIPLAWGHGGTVIENMISLEESLNISKNDTNPFEWIKREDIKQRIDMSKWHDTIEHLAELNGMTTQEYKSYVYWCEENKRDVVDI